MWVCVGGGVRRKSQAAIPPPPPPQPTPMSMDSECASGCTWSMARAAARLWDGGPPGVVKQDKSSRGSVDRTKPSSDPQGGQNEQWREANRR